MKYDVSMHFEQNVSVHIQVHGDSVSHALELTFKRGNLFKPQHLRTFCVGDVVELKLSDPIANIVHFDDWNDDSRFFICCTCGWHEISRADFDKFITRSFGNRMMDARALEGEVA